MNKLRQMLQLQQQLNDSTNGKGWESGVTKNGKSINWKRCIYMECAEMIDSFAWKHWKNIDADPDWANLQIEVVDVWHFVMSLVLQEYKMQQLGDVGNIAEAIEAMPFYEVLLDGVEPYAAQELVMSQVESIMRDALSAKPELTALLAHFFDLVRLSSLDLNSLYRLYVGKNILNQFRQDNGYKDGTYTKIWDDKEDNTVMKELWELKGDLSAQELYGELKSAYSRLNR